MMRVVRHSLTDLPADVIDDRIGDSVLASRGFMSLWQSQGGTPVAWTAEEGNTVVAILPGVEFGMAGVRRFQSMPDGLYTRVFTDDNAGQSRGYLASQLVRAVRAYGYSKIFLYDFYGHLEECEGFDSVEHETSVVDISSPEWQPPDKKLQSEIRKAEREGITITSIEPGRHLGKFLALMRETETRHKRQQKYSDGFFAHLAELSTRDNRILWLWCEHEGSGAASHIFLVEGEMALHWQVYFDKQFSFLKPNQYILYRQAKELQARGVTRLNLGASLPEAAGLRAYKGKWGGEAVRYRSCVRRSGIGKLL